MKIMSKYTLKLTCKRKYLLCSLNQATAVNVIVNNIMLFNTSFPLSLKRAELAVFPKQTITQQSTAIIFTC